MQGYLRAGLISDITLAAIPSLLGGGHRLFGELAQDTDPAPHEAKSFPAGLVQLHYRLP